MSKFCSRPLLSLLALLVASSLSGWAAQPGTSLNGHFNGVLLGQSGQPLADVLVSLLEVSSESALPILAKTDERGKVQLRGLQAGTYQLQVKSGDYRSPARRLVEILPGQTAVVTLILQQLLQLEASTEEELDFKALFRNSGNRRLIFRGLPGYEETFRENRREALFEDAVFQMYTHSGLGGDYFVYPGDSWGGTSTNFAVVESLNGSTDYIMAGQMSSGRDSLWRTKHFVDHRVNDQHLLRFFMGYGRLSFDQPSLSLLQNPERLSDHSDYTSALGTTRFLTLGVEDQFFFVPALSVTVGMELNQVRDSRNETFVSPSARLDFVPWDGTSLELLVASKRSTHGNTVGLTDGRQINLSDSLYFSQIGEQLNIGQARYYQAELRQALTEDTSVEVALFNNQRQGGGIPVLAILEYSDQSELVRLDEDQAETRGYRVSVSHSIGENLSTEISYLKGNAAALHDRTSIVFDYDSLDKVLKRQGFHAISAQVQAYLPETRTHITALFGIVPGGHPITSIDPYSDVYETSNEGVNLFLRQVVPVPVGLLGFVGLDFLAPEKMEALLDIRNLMNDDLGFIETVQGPVMLVRNPRTVRGGIAFKF